MSNRIMSDMRSAQNSQLWEAALPVNSKAEAVKARKRSRRVGFIGQSQFTGIIVSNGYTVSLDRLFIHRVNSAGKN